MIQNDILKMAEYSGIAYQAIQPECSNIRLKVIDDPETDIQCILRQKENTLCISFRGTDSLKDFITDVQFWKKKIPYDNHNSRIRVHSGFIERYKKPQIRDCIRFCITENIEKIQLTGHSYGAALAVLCAVDLQYHFPKKDYEVFLFGCPRVGNRAFASSYNKRIFKTLRFENGNDLVTKIPFCLLGYCHVGTKVHIGRKRIAGIYSFAQHFCQKYYAGLLGFEQ